MMIEFHFRFRLKCWLCVRAENIIKWRGGIVWAKNFKSMSFQFDGRTPGRLSEYIPHACLTLIIDLHSVKDPVTSLHTYRYTFNYQRNFRALRFTHLEVKLLGESPIKTWLTNNSE